MTSSATPAASKAAGVAPRVASTGAPVVFEIPIEPFWVQRGEPRYMRWTSPSSNPHLKKAYPLINRVEVDFRYR